MESAYAIFRFAKSIVEDQLDLEEDHPKTWILIGTKKRVPH